VRRKRFAPTAFFFVAAAACRRLLCEFFSVSDVNTFLSVKQIMITSFKNCFEQLSLIFIQTPIAVKMIYTTADSADGRVER